MSKLNTLGIRLDCPLSSVVAFGWSLTWLFFETVFEAVKEEGGKGQGGATGSVVCLLPGKASVAVTSLPSFLPRKPSLISLAVDLLLSFK